MPIEAWSVCANECLRSHFSVEIWSSPCLELRNFLMLHPYPTVAWLYMLLVVLGRMLR